MTQEYSIVGTNVPKVDAPALVTGKALFSIDEFVPGMLYARILKSPHAHANIRSINTSKAEALPGVEAVLTYEDVLPIGTDGGGGEGTVKVLDSKVRYVGDEVAAVAAVSEEIAEEALDLIDVDYETLPAVFDPEEALKTDAPKLYPEMEGGNNIFGRSWVEELGDIESGFTESDMVYEDVFTTFPQAVAPLGRLCCISWWEIDQLMVIISTQVPTQVQARLARWLDMPLSKIRITSKFMGSGMGEQNTYRFEGIAAYLARKTNKPVKMITDRWYHFVGSAKRRANSKIYIKGGFKNDGSIVALSSRIIWDKGADTSGGPPAMTWAVAVGFSGVYEIQNVRDEITGVYTNTPPNGSYRGWGTPEAIWALETFMDRAANKLGLDPLEFRLNNATANRSTRPLEIAAEMIDWSNSWSPPETKTGTKRRGLGMSTVIGWMGGYGFPHSSAAIQLLSDGKASLTMAIGDMGTGSRTTMVMVAAEALGMKYEDVTIYDGDTTYPYDLGSFASRVAINGGTAVYNAAEDLKTKLFAIVAPELGVEPGDIDAKDGIIFAKSDASNSMTYKAATELVGGIGLTGALLGWGNTPGYGPLEDINPISAQMWEVEVDTETGQVELLNVANVFDVGRCLHPAICDAQLLGGMVIGIGFGLTEDIVYDPSTGATLNASLVNYGLPTILDIPDNFNILAYEEEPNPCTVYGQRGCGEPSVVPPAPAINNAIYNAIGVSCNGAPITPAKILKLLGKA